MAKKPKENPEDFPFLGRMFMWVEKPGSVKILTNSLIAFCVIAVLANFTFSKKGHFGVESVPGFYALYGFVAFTFIIFVAKALRTVIMRDESYYGEKAIDTEEYPPEELEKINHD